MRQRPEAALESLHPAVRTSDSAVTNLYKRHADEAYRLAYLLTHDRHLSQDLVQEAFVKLIGRSPRLQQPERFGGYLYRTVLNLVRGGWRRRSIERRVLKGERDSSISSDHAGNVVESESLWQCLSNLPVRQRAVLFFFYYADLTEAQTAEAMDCSVSAVKSLKLRALKQLRSEMGGSDESA
jgi:RNA polymerase sigma-70 factor (sigma-E family)